MGCGGVNIREGSEVESEEATHVESSSVLKEVGICVLWG